MSDNKNMLQEKRTPEPILPGYKAVLELLSSNPGQISRLYCLRNLRGKEQVANLCQRNGIPIEFCGQDRLDSLIPAQDHKIAHQGLIAVLSRANLVSDRELFQSVSQAPLPLILALDQIQDPGNLGTLCRTAYALGAAGIILPQHDSANLGPAAFKSSMGTLAELPVAMVVNLARSLDLAEEEGLGIYGTGLNPENISSENAYSCVWKLPAVLVLGNEQKGIRPGVAKRCSYNLVIPFARPFDSLNIAQAGAILLGLCAKFQMDKQSHP